MKNYLMQRHDTFIIAQVQYYYFVITKKYFLTKIYISFRKNCNNFSSVH
jgi:hypothetical protein